MKVLRRNSKQPFPRPCQDEERDVMIKSTTGGGERRVRSGVRFASVAQMVEQRFRKPPVGGSSPLAGFIPTDFTFPDLFRLAGT